MDFTLLEEGLSLQEQNQLKAFTKVFGHASHFWLACHAVFPLALTPDLLYKIWGNFRVDEQGRELEIPIIAVSDILQSTLCRRIGHNLYQIPEAIRQNLLKALQQNKGFGAARIHRLAAFMKYYLQECPEKLPFPALREAQEWETTALLDRDAAAKLILNTIDKLDADPYHNIKLQILLSVADQSEQLLMPEQPESAGKHSLLDAARKIAAANRLYAEGSADDALKKLLDLENMVSLREDPQSYRTKIPEEVFERFSEQMRSKSLPAESKDPVNKARPGPSFPLLFFAFANSQAKPLPTLREEEDTVYQSLTPRSLRQHFIIHRDSFSSTAKIIEYLVLYRDQISLFHFSGHAGRDALFQPDQVANAASFPELLGQCPQLKLVFLNGCATASQVSLLLEEGVPLVIATSAPVEDRTATAFSIYFYQSLAEQYCTVREAFERAKGAAMVNSYDLSIQEQRGFRLHEYQQDEPLWGLFYQDERSLEWKLPTAPTPQLTFKPNEFLIESLIEALEPYNEEAKKIMDDEALGMERSILDKREIILKTFPHPISEHLRKLLVPSSIETAQLYYDKIGLPRLQQLLVSYDVLIQLLAYIMLAQLWEAALAGNAKLSAGPEAEKIRAFFGLKEGERRVYPFSHLIGAIHHILNANNVFSLVGELAELAEQLDNNSTELSRNIRNLDVIKTRLERNHMEEEEIVEWCLRAEESLSKVLAASAFLNHYTLLSIKNVEVVKYRHLPQPQYRHSAVRLVQRFVGLQEEAFVREQILESASVVLIRNQDTDSLHLNLSPFIIDENAFDSKALIAKIYFFSRYDQASDAYSYKHIYKPKDPPLVVIDQKLFQRVKTEFDAFAKLIFHHPMQKI